jgi:rubredoxin
MPTYLHCPHCEYPQIVPGRKLGKTRFCRQCGWAYQTSRATGMARALPVSTMGELRNSHPQQHQPAVFVIDS